MILSVGISWYQLDSNQTVIDEIEDNKFSTMSAKLHNSVEIHWKYKNIELNFQV